MQRRHRAVIAAIEAVPLVRVGPDFSVRHDVAAVGHARNRVAVGRFRADVAQRQRTWQDRSAVDGHSRARDVHVVSGECGDRLEVRLAAGVRAKDRKRVAAVVVLARVGDGECRRTKRDDVPAMQRRIPVDIANVDPRRQRRRVIDRNSPRASRDDKKSQIHGHDADERQAKRLQERLDGVRRKARQSHYVRRRTFCFAFWRPPPRRAL